MATSSLARARESATKEPTYQTNLSKKGIRPSKRSGFTTEELTALLESQGIAKPPEPKAGFLQRAISLLRVGETAEATLRSAENGKLFIQNYRDTALERISTTLTGKLPDKPDRTWEDYLKMKGWVDNPGKADLTDFAGFVGDVLLDPTTYITLGTGKAVQIAGKEGSKAGLKLLGKKMTKEGLSRVAAEEAVAKELGKKAFAKKAVRFAGVPIIPLREGDPLLKITAAKLASAKVPILRNIYDAIGNAFKWDYKPIGQSYDEFAGLIKVTEDLRTASQAARPLTRLEINDWVKKLDEKTGIKVSAAIEEVNTEFGEDAANAIISQAIRSVDKNDVNRLAQRALQLESPKVTEMMEIQRQLQYAKPDEAIDLQRRLFQIADDVQLQDELSSIGSRTDTGDIASFIDDVHKNINELDEARLGAKLQKLETNTLFSELPPHAQRAAKAALEIGQRRQKSLSRIGYKIGDLDLEDFNVGGYIAHIPTKEYLKYKKNNPYISKFVTSTSDKVKSRTLRGSAAQINDDFKLAVATSEYLKKKGKNLGDATIQEEFNNLMAVFKSGTDVVDDRLKKDLFEIRQAAEKLPDMFETDIRVIAEAMGISEKQALAKRKFLTDLHKLGEPAPEVLTKLDRAVGIENISFISKDSVSRLSKANLELEDLANSNAEDIASLLGVSSTKAKSIITQAQKLAEGAPQKTHIIDPGMAQVQTIPGLSHLQFPEPIANAIDEFGEGFFNKREVKQLVKGWDKVNNFYKGTLTAIFPSYHGRNMMSNVANGSLDNAFLFLRPDIQNWSGRLVSGKGLEKTITTNLGEKLTLKQIQQEGIKRGVTGADFFRAEVGVDPTFKTWVDKLNPVKQGQRLGTKIEDHAKWAMFVDNLRRGQSFDVAASKVKEYLFDYGQLTSFEKNVMRRIFPFYTWSRKNLTLQARNMIEQPGKYATLFKTIRTLSAGGNLDKEEFDSLPPWLQDSLAIKVGTDKYGAPKYISGLGLPIEEFTTTADQFMGLLATTTGTGDKRDRERAMQLAGRTAFVPKAIVERVMHIDFFTGKDVSEVTNANQAVALIDNWATRHLINDEMQQAMMNWLEIREVDQPIYRNGVVVGNRIKYEGNPEKLQLLRQLPTSRVQSSLGKKRQFAEEGEAFRGEELLNFTTGLRSYVVDPETQAYSNERDLEKQLEDQLIRLNVLKDFTRTYIPKEPTPTRRPGEFKGQ